MEKVDEVRDKALNIIIMVFEDKSYSNILLKNLGDNFTQLDRSFITEIVYGTIKWKLRLDNIISQFSSIKIEKINISVLNILRMGIYQIEFMNKVPESAAVNECVKLAKKYSNPGGAKYTNAILRNYLRNRDHIKYPNKNNDIIRFYSVYYSFPEWMVSMLITEFGQDFTEEFLMESNGIAPLTIRVNRLRVDKESLKDSLIKKGIIVNDGFYMEDALILNNVPGIGNLEEYKNGLFTVQDESSMAAAYVMSPQPGDLVMDVCSAPGTKSTFIAEIMKNKGTVISGDISSLRLKLVDEDAKRLGINIISTICCDATKVMQNYAGKADRVLLDVPCSNLGIMRKKPEIRWNRDISNIYDIKKTQRLILDASSNYVKIGGVLVYSTCTVLKNENINIISDFIEKNKSFVIEDLSDSIPCKLKKESCSSGFIQLYPNIDKIDGFFIAKLRRVK